MTEPPRAPSDGRWRALAWVALLTAFVGGAAGLDFGEHWDEWQHVDAALEALHTARPLPRFYNYPSLTFDLTLASLGAQLGVAVLRADAPLTDAWLEGYVKRRHGDLRRRTRALFLALSLLAGAALFELGRLMAGPRTGALAAGLLAGSHEYLYHARWITPDGLLAAALTATLACLAQVARSGRARALWWAAVAAGLATSAKYTGVFLVPAVMLAGPLLGVGARGAAWRRAVALGAVSAAVFLATSPGALLETGKLLEHIEEQQRVYAAGHRVYTVEAGLPHVAHVLRWAGTQLFDRWPALNLALAALGLVGLAVAARRRPRLLALLALAALPYLGLLVAHRTFLVRNLVPWIPVAALLVALGLRAAVARLPHSLTRAAGIGAALLVALLLARRVHDGLEIGRHAHDPGHAFRAAVEELSGQPELRVHVAKEVRWRLRPLGLELPGAVDDPARAEHALILPRFLPSTGAGHLLRWWGVHDVNYAYYHSWHQRKPALVDIETARRYGELGDTPPAGR